MYFRFYPNGKVKAPCKDCEDREPGCHSKCEKYIEYSKDREALREARRTAIDLYEVRRKKRD